MTPDTPRSPAQRARERQPEVLVQLLVDHIDQAYTADGIPGALTALRELLRQMDPETLGDMVYQMELNTEPLRQDDPTEPRQHPA